MTRYSRPFWRTSVSFLTAVVLIVTLSAADSGAVEGSIAISGQPNTNWCTLTDSGPAIRTVYVLHTFSLGAIASRFRIMNGPGATLTYLSETHPFASTIGDTQTGVSICYGGCFSGEHLIATVTYMGYGTSGLCSKLLVVPHPLSQTVEAINCNFDPVPTYVQDLAINTATGTCGCPLVHSFPGAAQAFTCDPVATQPTTWGSVKALYR